MRVDHRAPSPAPPRASARRSRRRPSRRSPARVAGPRRQRELPAGAGAAPHGRLRRQPFGRRRAPDRRRGGLPPSAHRAPGQSSGAIQEIAIGRSSTAGRSPYCGDAAVVALRRGTLRTARRPHRRRTSRTEPGGGRSRAGQLNAKCAAAKRAYPAIPGRDFLPAGGDRSLTAVRVPEPARTRARPQQSHAHGGQLCPATHAAHAHPHPPTAVGHRFHLDARAARTRRRDADDAELDPAARIHAVGRRRLSASPCAAHGSAIGAAGSARSRAASYRGHHDHRPVVAFQSPRRCRSRRRSRRARQVVPGAQVGHAQVQRRRRRRRRRCRNRRHRSLQSHVQGGQACAGRAGHDTCRCTCRRHRRPPGRRIRAVALDRRAGGVHGTGDRLHAGAAAARGVARVTVAARLAALSERDRDRSPRTRASAPTTRTAYRLRSAACPPAAAQASGVTHTPTGHAAPAGQAAFDRAPFAGRRCPRTSPDFTCRAASVVDERGRHRLAAGLRITTADGGGEQQQSALHGAGTPGQ